MKINKSIGVFFGSRSPEHDISIITAQLIINGLKGLGHKVTPIYISKKGKWYTGEKLASIKTFQDENYLESLQGLDAYNIDIQNSQGKILLKKKGLSRKTISIDIALPALHGSYGEDGTIQGLFEIFNIPFVGCDLPSSSIAMDKVLTKILFESINIPTPPYIHFTKTKWENNKDTLIQNAEKIGYPLFVKPAHLGSSIAIEKTTTKTELENAVNIALHYDTKVLIEKGIEPMRDITCAVLEKENTLTSSLLQESRYEHGFFSYEDKYLKEGGAQLGKAKSSLTIPAKLDKETTKKIQDMSIKAFEEIGCGGTARFDFLYNPKTKEIWANEINPLPGTLYHHLWEKSGVSLSELLTTLINNAEKRHRDKQNLSHTFTSSVLSKTTPNKTKGGTTMIS